MSKKEWMFNYTRATKMQNKKRGALLEANAAEQQGRAFSALDPANGVPTKLQ
jgi:hypothetical protein